MHANYFRISRAKGACNNIADPKCIHKPMGEAMTDQKNMRN